MLRQFCNSCLLRGENTCTAAKRLKYFRAHAFPLASSGFLCRVAAVALAFTLFSPLAAIAQFAYDRHVVFDNSTGNVPYYYSRASATAPSELVTENGKLPVSTEHCVSPPNCLRLSWQSGF